jgi:hypothetical protein
MSRAHAQLKKDSEEINRALEEFMLERHAASELAEAAQRAYEQEMADIGVGNMANIEDEMDEHNPLSQSQSMAPVEGNTVDHNIRRLMKLTGDEGKGDDEDGGEYDDADDYDDDYDYDGEYEGGGLGEGSLTKSTDTLGRTKKKKKNKLFDVQVKRSMPEPAVKKEMRAKLFGMLSSQKNDERDLEDEIAGMRAQDDPNEHLISEVSDMLLEKQKEHFEKLSEFVSDYMPHPSGQAWGGDPEYFKMLREMKARVERNYERNYA